MTTYTCTHIAITSQIKKMFYQIYEILECRDLKNLEYNAIMSQI